MCVFVDGSYTSLNYQAGECQCAMAGSHTANSELELHPAHRLTEESLSVYGKKCFRRIGRGLWTSKQLSNKIIRSTTLYYSTQTQEECANSHIM